MEGNWFVFEFNPFNYGKKDIKLFEDMKFFFEKHCFETFCKREVLKTEHPEIKNITDMHDYIMRCLPVISLSVCYFPLSNIQKNKHKIELKVIIDSYIANELDCNSEELAWFIIEDCCNYFDKESNINILALNELQEKELEFYINKLYLEKKGKTIYEEFVSDLPTDDAYKDKCKRKWYFITQLADGQLDSTEVGNIISLHRQIKGNRN